MKLTQREHAYRHIRRKLVEGSLPVGQRLSPAALAQELGVSHIPVREAISQLHSEGLVVHAAHRGAFVKGVDRRTLVDLIEMRSVLECHAAGRAARRISAAQLIDLTRCREDLRRAAAAFNVSPNSDLREPLRRWLLADLPFHVVLLRAAGNAHVLRVIEETRVMTHMFGYRTDSPGAWADPAAFGAKNLQLHQDIYDAVVAHDAKRARRAMSLHMRCAGKNMLARYDWLQRQTDLGSELAGEFPDSMRDLVRDIQQQSMGGVRSGRTITLGKMNTKNKSLMN
jgi:DNA-binding GntR family transcriptional regulator